MDQGNLEILFLLKEKNGKQSFSQNFRYTAKTIYLLFPYFSIYNGCLG